MSYTDISFYTLKQVVADLGTIFSTYDVVEDPRMTKAHLNLVGDSSYPGFVGRALSAYRAQLKIDKTGRQSSRGTEWKKI